MWRDDHLILDMLIYARQTRQFNTGVTWERFSADKYRSMPRNTAFSASVRRLSRCPKNTGRCTRKFHGKGLPPFVIAWFTIIPAWNYPRFGRWLIATSAH